eukprot:352966-Chlamydomonas_euryale.AAC.1
MGRGRAKARSSHTKASRPSHTWRMPLPFRKQRASKVMVCQCSPAAFEIVWGNCGQHSRHAPVPDLVDCAVGGDVALQGVWCGVWGLEGTGRRRSGERLGVCGVGVGVGGELRRRGWGGREGKRRQEGGRG